MNHGGGGYFKVASRPGDDYNTRLTERERHIPWGVEEVTSGRVAHNARV